MFTEKLFAECVASSEAQLTARTNVTASDRASTSLPPSPLQTNVSSPTNVDAAIVNSAVDVSTRARDAESSTERVSSNAAQLLETELLVLAPWCGNIALDDLKELSADAFLKATLFALIQNNVAHVHCHSRCLCISLCRGLHRRQTASPVCLPV